MTMQAFNSESLKASLSRLNQKQQLIFGAMCCERLLPNYLMFQKDVEWGDINSIHRALDCIWKSLKGNKVTKKNIDLLIESCEKVIPDSDDFESLYVSLAQDCAFSVCCLLYYLLKSDVNKIVEVAIYATDSVDLYVQETERMDPSSPDLEKRILTHSFMQRELLTQEKNFTAIEQAPSLSTNFVNNPRNSWDNNGKSNLDLP